MANMPLSFQAPPSTDSSTFAVLAFDEDMVVEV